jgi:hypothetical protein
MDVGGYWVYVLGRFVRFEAQTPTPRWRMTRQLRGGYCFRTVADATYIANQA